MLAIIKSSLHRTAPDNKWLQQLLKTGFIFFLVKGLVWTGVAIWFISFD